MIPEQIKKKVGFCSWCDTIWCHIKNPKSRCKRYKKYQNKINKSVRMQIKQRKDDYYD